MPLHSDGGLYFFILVLGAAGYMIQDMGEKKRKDKWPNELAIGQSYARFLQKADGPIPANTIKLFRQISKVCTSAFDRLVGDDSETAK